MNANPFFESLHAALHRAAPPQIDCSVNVELEMISEDIRGNPMRAMASGIVYHDGDIWRARIRSVIAVSGGQAFNVMPFITGKLRESIEEEMIEDHAPAGEDE